MMALTTSRPAAAMQTVRPTPAGGRRCVKVMAVQQPGKHSKMLAAVAAAAAACLLSGPAAIASPLPTINHVVELATNPVNKALNYLDSKDPPKGVKGPEVEGQFRSNPDKARALAAENSPAGSPEAEAKGIGACPCTGQMDCPC